MNHWFQWVSYNLSLLNRPDYDSYDIRGAMMVVEVKVAKIPHDAVAQVSNYSPARQCTWSFPAGLLFWIMCVLICIIELIVVLYNMLCKSYIWRNRFSTCSTSSSNLTWLFSTQLASLWVHFSIEHLIVQAHETTWYKPNPIKVNNKGTDWPTLGKFSVGNTGLDNQGCTVPILLGFW